VSGEPIAFNRPYLTGRELAHIAEAHADARLSGDGRFTRKCQDWLQTASGTPQALLTHSCTAALEIAALLADLRPGDEVIMPSYTFTSSANAFVLRGAVPVFVDVREDTLNIDETAIESAVTSRSKAIVPVHYAGVGCEMDVIMDIARRRGLLVIEDAAQALLATYRGRALGTFGPLAALSFHDTKNITCGEGGALFVNAPAFAGRAEILREKGTDRGRFFRGEVDRYTWCDVGSSYVLGELSAAFLWAQMQEAEAITRRRLAMWERYHEAFAALEREGRLRRPVVPRHCGHNAHMYYLLLPDLERRAAFIRRLKERGINTVFHYVPLHLSPKGRECGRSVGELRHTVASSERLVRLPLWVGLEPAQARVIEEVVAAVRALC
jgi:dTDP-4-amino-4,6-dideoxygalactose transaminase